MATRLKSAKASKKKELEAHTKKMMELTKACDVLKQENESLKQKIKVICQKVVDNTELSNYKFIDPAIEPDKIETKDILHMIQTLGLLATKLSNTKEGFENHLENLECRITELVSEQGNIFKTKLKLQERLEFIMQERDVWKRNAETIKKLYEKLLKDHEDIQRPPVNSIVVGAYKANTDTKQINQRVFSATIPMSHYENLRNRKIDRIQYDSINFQLMKQLSQLKTPQQQQQQQQSGNKENESEVEVIYPIAPNIPKSNSFRQPSPAKHDFSTSSPTNNSKSYDNSTVQEETMSAFNRFHDYSPLQNVPDIPTPNDLNSSLQSFSDIDQQSGYSSNELFERTPFQHVPIRKNVSFNKDIDIRTFQNNSLGVFPKLNTDLINTKPHIIIDHSNDQRVSLHEQPKSILITTKLNNFESSDTLINADYLMNETNGRDIGIRSADDIGSVNSNGIHRQLQNRDSFSMSSFPGNGILDGRRSFCSDRKLPGETSVKELERTLKMAIIKELSVEKIDGNDWRMFAKRIGISDNDVKEWIILKLQFPMARVLSVWSCNVEATVRLLHRHLQAPCFKYNSLTKRLESYYDV